MAAGSERGDRTSNALRSRMSSTSPPSVGDPLPASCELIEVHVSELKQLFNAIDPSPFRERDLDPDAEEFIADWAKEASPSATLGRLPRPAGRTAERSERAPGSHFTNSSVTARRIRDAGYASSFAEAGRASSLASAHSASRWPPDTSSGASTALTSPRLLKKFRLERFPANP